MRTVASGREALAGAGRAPAPLPLGVLRRQWTPPSTAISGIRLAQRSAWLERSTRATAGAGTPRIGASGGSLYRTGALKDGEEFLLIYCMDDDGDLEHRAEDAAKKAAEAAVCTSRLSKIAADLAVRKAEQAAKKANGAQTVAEAAERVAKAAQEFAK